MGSEDESDSDDSNIANMFAKAEKHMSSAIKRQRKSDKESDDDDDDEGDFRISSARRHGKKTVGERLANLEHQKIIADNKRREEKERSLEVASDDDDDVVVCVGIVNGTQQRNLANGACQNLTNKLPDADSSDDENQPVARKLPFEYFQQLEGVDPQILNVLQEAHAAKARLRQAQSYRVADTDQPTALLLQQQLQQQQRFQPMDLRRLPEYKQFMEAVQHHGSLPPNSDHLLDIIFSRFDQPQMTENLAVANNSARVLNVTIHVEISAVDGSEETKKQTVQLVMRADEDFQSLNQKLLNHLNFKGNKRATFKHGTKTLNLFNTPNGYEMPGPNIVLEAKILVAGGLSIPNAPSGGKSMWFRIRDKTNTTFRVQHGEKQPFSVLVETVRRKLVEDGNPPPNNATLKLVFDGECLNFQKNPKDYDMESEDLIDLGGF